MPKVFPISYPDNARVMIFVDGENLSIRFKAFIKNEGIEKLEDHIGYEPDIYVWSQFLSLQTQFICAIIRIFYYTSVQGDDKKIISMADSLKGLGVTDPKVFKKTKGKRTKRVDITLATDMLSHAYSDNYDIAILVAGDDDYVPLVKEIKHCGKQVSLWFLENGLSPSLKRECDLFFNMKKIFVTETNLLRQFTYN